MSGITIEQSVIIKLCHALYIYRVTGIPQPGSPSRRASHGHLTYETAKLSQGHAADEQES